MQPHTVASLAGSDVVNGGAERCDVVRNACPRDAHDEAQVHFFLDIRTRGTYKLITLRFYKSQILNWENHSMKNATKKAAAKKAPAKKAPAKKAAAKKAPAKKAPAKKAAAKKAPAKKAAAKK